MHYLDQQALDRLDKIIQLLGGSADMVTPESRVKTYNVATVAEAAGQLKVADTANTTFYNAGASTAVILNAIELAPGQGVSFPVNTAEQDVTRYTYTFTGAGINKLVIVQRLYTQ